MADPEAVLAAKRQAFGIFVDILDYVNTPPGVGLGVIRDFPTDDDMFEHVDMMKEWRHWEAAAGAAAELNTRSELPAEDDIYAAMATHVLLDNPVAAPRYNMCISIMHFTMHQFQHAFGRVRGLPYPELDGSRSYTRPGPALETAFLGRSNLEVETEIAWKAFLRASAARAGIQHQLESDDEGEDEAGEDADEEGH